MWKWNSNIYTLQTDHGPEESSESCLTQSCHGPAWTPKWEPHCQLPSGCGVEVPLLFRTTLLLLALRVTLPCHSLLVTCIQGWAVGFSISPWTAL